MEKVRVLIQQAGPKSKRVVADLTSIAILGLPVLFLFLFGQPYQRGFFCDDESIRYPFKDSTIPNYVLIIYTILIPVVTFLIVEIGLFLRHRKSQQLMYLELAWQLYETLAPFAFGALASQLTTDIAKYSIGRLRPHFIDVCHPYYNGVTFTRENLTVCQAYSHVYIFDFTCTNTKYDASRYREARLSFMSGHSSFSAFCLVYLAIYLQIRCRWSPFGLIRPLFQAFCLYLTFFTGLSRVSDYKHHWSDVLVGLLQGTAVAWLTTRFASDLLSPAGQAKYRIAKDKSDIEEGDSTTDFVGQPMINYKSQQQTDSNIFQTAFLNNLNAH